MSEPTGQRAPWGTRHKDMLDQVFPLWSGPRALESPALDGGRFYGWSVLQLAARFDYPMRLESRTVYAHLFDSEQPVAVLRALAWDDEAARATIREQGQSAPLVVPVRFVRLPLDQLRTWLTPFKDMAITAEQTVVEDPKLPIRRLRVEWEYTSSVLEKVWKQQGPQHAQLLAAWTRVWGEMGEALRTAPQLAPQGIEEIFETTPPDTRVYDPQRYQPEWLTFS